eukprot:1956041-Pyramimonas_sp.AAC.1
MPRGRVLKRLSSSSDSSSCVRTSESNIASPGPSVVSTLVVTIFDVCCLTWASVGNVICANGVHQRGKT